MNALKASRTAVIVLVATLATLVGATSAQAGATRLTFSFTESPETLVSLCDPPAAVPTVWTSDGVLHIRDAPACVVFRDTTSAGVIDLTTRYVFNANIALATGDGTEWGSIGFDVTLNGTPLGTWEGSFRGTVAGFLDSGTATAQGSDQSTLKQSFTGIAPGVYEVEFTILYPHG